MVGEWIRAGSHEWVGDVTHNATSYFRRSKCWCVGSHTTGRHKNLFTIQLHVQTDHIVLVNEAKKFYMKAYCWRGL